MKQLIACLFVFVLVVCGQHVAYSSPDNDVGVSIEQDIFKVCDVDQINYFNTEKEFVLNYNDYFIFSYDQPEKAELSFFAPGKSNDAKNPENTEEWIEAWCKIKTDSYYNFNYSSLVWVNDEVGVVMVTTLLSCRKNHE